MMRVPSTHNHLMHGNILLIFCGMMLHGIRRAVPQRVGAKTITAHVSNGTAEAFETSISSNMQAGMVSADHSICVVAAGRIA